LGGTTKIILGSIADFRNGVNFNKENFGSGIKVINVKDFQNYFAPRFDELSEINPDGVVPDASLLHENDVVFVRSNGNRELIGRSLFIVSEPIEPITHSAFTIRVRFNTELVFPRFYAYLFRSNLIRNVLSSYGGGTNISNLNQGILSKLEVPLPPLETQRRIAAILSAYDDLIENNTRRITALEQAAHDLYREWFVHFRFPGHESVEMVDSGTDYGMIPHGWGVQSVDDSFDILGGGTPSTKKPEYWEDGDIVWFSPSDLTAAGSMFIRDSSRHINELGLQKSSAKIFPPYSVMMTSRATLGVTAINSVPACTNQGFITCIPNEKVSAYQIYFWVAENLEKIISVASGATFKEINKTTFRQFPFLIADSDVTNRFEEMVSPMGEQVENLLDRNNALREARDLLLPRLVSGQLDVSDVEVGHSEDV